MLKKIIDFFVFMSLTLIFVPSVHATSVIQYDEQYGVTEFTETGESFIYRKNSDRITKLDAEGGVIWSYRYSSYDIVDPALKFPMQIRLVRDAGDGGCIVEAHTKEDPTYRFSRPHRLLMKVATDGAVTWLNRYANSIALHSYTFPGLDALDIIKTVPDGGYLLAGTYVKDLGGSWAYLIKFDSAGNIEWQKKYFKRINTNIAMGAGGRVAQVADGGFVLAFNGSGLGTSNRIILKVDNSGDIEWQKELKSSVSSYPTGNRGWNDTKVLPTSDNGCILLAKTSSSKISIIKFDITTGETIWVRNINSGFTVLNIHSYFNDDIIVAFHDQYQWELNLMTITQDGDFGWAKNIDFSIPVVNTPGIALVDGGINIGGLLAYHGRFPILLKLDNEFISDGCVRISSLASPVTEDQLTIVDSSFTTEGNFNFDMGEFYAISFDEPTDATSSGLLPATIVCATNIPPVADAGDDMAIECTSSCGTEIVLDGSASFDGDGDSLSFTWEGPFSTIAGMNPTVSLPLGTSMINLTVDDGNGGTDTDQIVVTVSDTRAPSTSVIVSGSAGNNDWYVSPVTLELVASDICTGVSTLHYSLNGKSHSAYVEEAVNIELSEGINDISFFATDEAGNAERERQFSVNIDQTSPDIAIRGVEDGITYPSCQAPTPSYEALDALSGMADSSSVIDEVSGTGIVSYRYEVNASDIAGNMGNAEVNYQVVKGIQGVIELVRLYVARGLISPQMEVSLLAQLKDPCKLNAFVNHVRAQLGKKISPEAAEMLTNAANCLCMKQE